VIGNAGEDFITLLLNKSGIPTPTLLSLFDARWVDQGVEVRWQFGSTGVVGGVAVERGDAGTGPWVAVSGLPHLRDGIEVLLDATAPAGRRSFYRLVTMFASGKVATFGPIEATGTLPAEFALLPIGPNPSRGSASIAYDVPRASRVRLSVVDVQGRRAAVLVDGRVVAGHHALGLEAPNALASARAGLYFVRLEWPGGSAMRRLVIAR